MKTPPHPEDVAEALRNRIRKDDLTLSASEAMRIITMLQVPRTQVEAVGRLPADAAADAHSTPQMALAAPGSSRTLVGGAS